MRTHLLSVLPSVVAVGRSPPSAVHRLVLETGRHLTSRHSSPPPGNGFNEQTNCPLALT